MIHWARVGLPEHGGSNYLCLNLVVYMLCMMTRSQRIIECNYYLPTYNE